MWWGWCAGHGVCLSVCAGLQHALGAWAACGCQQPTSTAPAPASPAPPRPARALRRHTLLGRSIPAKYKYFHYMLMRLRRLLGLPLVPGGARSPEKGVSRAAVAIEELLQQRRWERAGCAGGEERLSSLAFFFREEAGQRAESRTDRATGGRLRAGGFCASHGEALKVKQSAGAQVF